jgi:hypothetical protein
MGQQPAHRWSQCGSLTKQTRVDDCRQLRSGVPFLSTSADAGGRDRPGRDGATATSCFDGRGWTVRLTPLFRRSTTQSTYSASDVC